MDTLKEICTKDGRYKEAIKDCSIVKNAVILLGGKTRVQGGEREGKEGVEGRREEEKGGLELGLTEFRLEEKISLISLMCELVKRGVELTREEEMKEVLMELEEEGNKHVEEEMSREGEEAKREWEELSERAHELVWVMEKMKNRREGKKSETLKMMREKEEEMEKKVEEMKRRVEEEKRRADEEQRMKEEEKKMKEEERRKREETEQKVEEERKRADEEHQKREEAEAKISTMRLAIEKLEKEHISSPPPHSVTPPTRVSKSISGPITLLDGTSVIIPQEGIRRDGNTIIHHGYASFRNCFIGGVMSSV